MPFYIGTSNNFTDYRTSCSVDEQIKKDNGIKSEEEYRLFLQRNGDKIRENFKKNVANKVKTMTYI
jgi:hypothetical protein